MLAVSLTACDSKPAPGPAIARADARALVALAARISREGACAQRRDIQLLQKRTLTLVNAHRVPIQLQDTLMSGVNALAADAPPCVPAVPVQTTPPTPTPQPRPHGHDHHEHHDKHPHGKHGGHD